MLIDLGKYHCELMVGTIKHGKFHSRKFLLLENDYKTIFITIVPVKTKNNFFETYSYSGGLSFVYSIGSIHAEEIYRMDDQSSLNYSIPSPMKDYEPEGQLGIIGI